MRICLYQKTATEAGNDMRFLKSVWLIVRYIFVAILLLLPAISVFVLLVMFQNLIGADAYNADFWLRVSIGIPVFYIFLIVTCGKYFRAKFATWLQA